MIDGMKLVRGMVFAALPMVFAACAHNAAMDTSAASAYAVVEDANGTRVGVAAFGEDAAGMVHVRMLVHGLAPGLHGVHVHGVGSCVAPSFASAGGHFNPGARHHGLENPQGPHAGDLPNMNVDAAGNADYRATTQRITLTPGAMSVFDTDGSALVIHAGPDDNMSDPAGNSGARVACGVIRSGVAPE